MSKSNSIVAVYQSHTDVEAAIKELQRADFDVTKLSVIGRDCHTDEHVVGYYNIGDRMKVWGKTGALWGGLSGFLLGSAFFWVPGLGPLLVAGPMVNWIVTALDGALVVGGLTTVGAALYSFGIPRDSILQYEKVLKTGKFILITHGSFDDTSKAKEILNTTEPEILEHHQ